MRYAISKVDTFEHPARPGRMVRAPVLLKYLFDAAKNPLGPATFHIDETSTWCLCKLDGGFDPAMATDPDVVLLPDKALGDSLVGRVQLSAARLKFGFATDPATLSTYRELLNSVGKELGSGFDVGFWR